MTPSVEAVRATLLARSMSFLLRVANSPRRIVVAVLSTFVLGSTGYALAEGASIVDGLWWAVVTGFTVGYGDLYPETVPGRLVALAYMIAMWALLAVISPAALAAKLIVDSNVFDHGEQEMVKRNGERSVELLTELVESARAGRAGGGDPSARAGTDPS